MLRWMNTTNFKTIDANAIETCVNGCLVSGWLAPNIQDRNKSHWCMWNISSSVTQQASTNLRWSNENQFCCCCFVCSTRWNHLLRRENDVRKCLICQKWKSWRSQNNQSKIQRTKTDSMPLHINAQMQRELHFWHETRARWISFRIRFGRFGMYIVQILFVFQFAATTSWQWLMMTF